MKNPAFRMVVIGSVVVAGWLVGAYVIFGPSQTGYMIMGVLTAVWASFLFMVLLLGSFFHKPWMSREQALTELKAQNEVFRLMFETTRQVGEAASSAKTIDRGLQASVETLRDKLNLDGCSLRLYDPSTESLESLAGIGYRGDDVKQVPLSSKTGIAGKAIQERRPVFVENPALEKDFVKADGGAPVKSLFCVPLIEQDEIVGVLSGSCQEKRKFDQHEQEVLALISARLASLLQLHRISKPA